MSKAQPGVEDSQCVPRTVSIRRHCIWWLVMPATDRACNYALFFPRRERRNATKRNLDLHCTSSINTHSKHVYRALVCICLPCQGNQSKKTTVLCEGYTNSPEQFPPVCICGRSGVWEFPLLSKLPPLLNLLCVGMFGYTDLLQGTEAIIKSINEPEVGHRFCPRFY